jgi:hypothetical protein
MKLFFLTFIGGLLLLALVDTALKIDSASREMLLHNLYHFFSGCLIFGLWVWLRRKRGIKFFVFLLLALLLLDEVMDIMRNVDQVTVAMLLHNLYLVFWGALTGLSLSRCVKNCRRLVSGKT